MTENMNVSIKKRLMAKAAKSRTPVSGIFELTPRCNMNCKMCYIRMTEEEMKPIGRERTAEEWIQLGKSCAEKGMLFLLLTGGEPFIRADFSYIYTELKKLGLLVSINSNATLLDDEKIDFLAKNPPHIINITLYGASNETYKKLCMNPDGFDRVTYAIDALRERNVPIQINVSLTKENIGDLEQIVEFGKSRNLPMKITSYMFNPVRKKDGNCELDSSVFDEFECGEARMKTMKAQLPEKLFERVRMQFRSDVFTVDINNNDECDLTGYGMDCAAGRSSFWVTWDGRMTPCGMMNVPVTKPFEIGFADAWKFIVDEVNLITLPAECKNCKARKICHPCGAMVYTENGCFSKKPEYLCRSTQEYIRLMKGTQE